MSATTPVRITVGGSTIRGILRNNAATEFLIAQLPLELSSSDFGRQEKIAPLPTPLPLDGLPPGSTTEPGTIGYYAPRQALVLYCDTVGYHKGIIPNRNFRRRRNNP
jgi:hypothetical protein